MLFLVLEGMRTTSAVPSASSTRKRLPPGVLVTRTMRCASDGSGNSESTASTRLPRPMLLLQGSGHGDTHRPELGGGMTTVKGGAAKVKRRETTDIFEGEVIVA